MIRKYTNGAKLMPHLDHMETHIISAILNIGQKVWSRKAETFLPPLIQGGGAMASPDSRSQRQTAQHLLESWGNGGWSFYNHTYIITSHGTEVWYESASLVHARSKPLNGSSFENLFVHYMPRSKLWYKTDWNVKFGRPDPLITWDAL